MMRISRAEEFYHGSARLGFQGQVKLGFAEDGKLLAADIYVWCKGESDDAKQAAARAQTASNAAWSAVIE